MNIDVDDCKPVKCPYKLTLIEIIGWGGAVLLITAYYLIQSEIVKSDDVIYSTLNVLAAAMLFINAWEHRAYPSLIINAVWFMIGACTLI